MDNLTIKQRAWAEAYLETLNGTEAARLAKYKGNDNTLGVIGHENLRKPKIRKYIEARLAQMVITANEVLFRLTEQATASVGDFITINPDGDRISINPDVVKEKGHLVKSVKAKTTVRYSKKGDQYEYSTIQIDLYNAQEALKLLGKYHTLFKEQLEVSWREEAMQAGKSPGELFESMVQQLSEQAGKNEGDTN